MCLVHKSEFAGKDIALNYILLNLMRNKLAVVLFLSLLANESFSLSLDSLNFKLKKLRQASLVAESDAEMLKLNAQFRLDLLNALKDQRQINFDSIPNLSVVKAPKDEFRIISWNIAFKDYSFYYDGILSKKQKKDWVHFPLKDISQRVESANNQQGSASAWYGLLYYDIISFGKAKDQQYLLLAWDGNDQYSNMKVIDVLWFDEAGLPRFGKKVFNTPYLSNTRVIFEYSKDASMSLRYEEKKEWLVFDHLSPLQPNMNGMYEFYVPDLSFDALRYTNKKWQLIQNVDVRGDQTMDEYNTPPASPLR